MDAMALNLSQVISGYRYHVISGFGPSEYQGQALEEALKQDWLLTLDESRGACFTFDPSHINEDFVPIQYLRMQGAELATFQVDLNVRMNIFGYF